MTIYEKPKYIQFIEYYESKGFKVELHKAVTTFSKYIFLEKNNKKVKVRFSNHSPNKLKESNLDSDFYVGKVNFNKWKTAREVAIEINKIYKEI